METVDYEKCRSAEVISPKRMKILERITGGRDCRVVEKIEEYGIAGYQEDVGGRRCDYFEQKVN